MAPDVDSEEVLLMVGKAQGHYRITSQLGEDRMGDVHRPKDR
jgi:hypothetical protein